MFVPEFDEDVSSAISELHFSAARQSRDPPHGNQDACFVRSQGRPGNALF
jgi:hypothetical protein